MPSYNLNLRAYANLGLLLVVWIVFALLAARTDAFSAEEPTWAGAIKSVANGEGMLLTSRNLSNLFRQMCVTGALAIGMTLVIASGNIDLSVGSLAGLLGGVATVLSVRAGWDDPLAMGATLALGVVIGLVSGFLITRLQVPSFIVTLGGLLCFRGLLLWLTDGESISLNEGLYASLGTWSLPHQAGWIVAAAAVLAILAGVGRSRAARRSHGLAVPSFSMDAVRALTMSAGVIWFVWAMNRYRGVPAQCLIVMALAVAFTAMASRTRFGRAIYAVGGNLEAARLSGIDVRGTVVRVYGLMGLLCAAAGMMLASKIGVSDPQAGYLLELNAIAACVIGGSSLAGGRGTVAGALMGALIMESIDNGMSMMNLKSHWQYVVKGLVLIAAVSVDLGSRRKRA